jgi:hypothetical protein
MRAGAWFLLSPAALHGKWPGSPRINSPATSQSTQCASFLAAQGYTLILTARDEKLLSDVARLLTVGD